MPWGEHTPCLDRVDAESFSFLMRRFTCPEAIDRLSERGTRYIGPRPWSTRRRSLASIPSESAADGISSLLGEVSLEMLIYGGSQRTAFESIV